MSSTEESPELDANSSSVWSQCPASNPPIVVQNALVDALLLVGVDHWSDLKPVHWTPVRPLCGQLSLSLFI